MLGQRRRRWVNISPALGKRLVFDRLHDKMCWTEMNGTLTDRDSQTERTQVRQYVSSAVYRGET